MTFSAEAAKAAQEWSEKMNNEGSMYHSSNSERPGCGENLAYYSLESYAYGTDWATNAWYDEVNDPGYDFNNPGFSSGIGHFTQVVWKGSTELGCGVAGPYVTCRYCNGQKCIKS